MEVLTPKFKLQATSIGLLSVIVMSWALYPWAISWVYPQLVRVVFGLGLLAIFVWLYFDGGKSKEKALVSWEFSLSLLWVIYLVCVALSTFVFNTGSLDLFLRYILKSIFFLILFFYLNKQTIFRSFDIYSNLCAALVVVSTAGILALYLGWIDVRLVQVTRGIDSFGEVGLIFSGFDGNARVFQETSQYMRMQSFAIEPGGFALAVLPALYWFVLVRKQYVRGSLITLGVAASWSFGALLAMILAFLVLYKSKLIDKGAKLFLAFSVAFFLFSHAGLSYFAAQTSTQTSTQTSAQTSTQTSAQTSAQTLVVGDRSASKQQRINELIQVKDFISVNHWGAGIGAGRFVLDSSISVGYANVFADTGIIGGVFYVLAFLLLGYEALRAVSGKYGASLDDEVSNAVVALGLVVLTCVFFGLQREQPDASFWHMWLYASFFSLYGITYQRKGSGNG